MGVGDDAREAGPAGEEADGGRLAHGGGAQFAQDGAGGGFAGAAAADVAGGPADDVLAPVEEQVLLGREVVVHRVDGDVGGPGDLRDRHAVEAAFQEQARGHVGDALPALALLALPQSLGRRHALIAAFLDSVKIWCQRHI